MNGDFDSIRNHHERSVSAAVRAAAPRFPHLHNEEFWPTSPASR